jgi:hypothetical protein
MLFKMKGFMRKASMAAMLFALALIVVLQLVGLNPAAADASGTVWDGNIDTDWYNAVDSEFTLDTAEQLAGLASLVNAGNDMEGKFFYLGADILLNDVGDFENWDTTPPLCGIGCR